MTERSEAKQNKNKNKKIKKEGASENFSRSARKIFARERAPEPMGRG